MKNVLCFETNEGKDLPNQESIGTFREKKNYKYLGIFEVITVVMKGMAYSIWSGYELL